MKETVCSSILVHSYPIYKELVIHVSSTISKIKCRFQTACQKTLFFLPRKKADNTPKGIHLPHLTTSCMSSDLYAWNKLPACVAQLWLASLVWLTGHFHLLVSNADLWNEGSSSKKRSEQLIAFFSMGQLRTVCVSVLTALTAGRNIPHLCAA